MGNNEVRTKRCCSRITSTVANMVVTMPVTTCLPSPDLSVSTVLGNGAPGISLRIMSITCCTVNFDCVKGINAFALLNPGIADQSYSCSDRFINSLLGTVVVFFLSDESFISRLFNIYTFVKELCTLSSSALILVLGSPSPNVSNGI